MIRLAALLALLATCASDAYTPPTDAERTQAASMAWTDLCHMKLAGTGVQSVQQPRWTWITGAALNCANGSGWIEPGGGCFDGSYYPAPVHGGQIALAWEWRIHQTALVHESCHAVQYFQGGDGDPGHTGICFQPGGWVDVETAALETAGY